MLNLIQIREDLHKIPELGFQEFKTSDYIKKILAEYDSLKIYPIAETGVLVDYSHGEGDYILFRADMDALPITEKTDCLFASKHLGIMHACGHDIHMTILLGLIDEVVNENIRKNILFLFQPAEEGKGGAKRVLESNIFQGYKIQQCFALHVSGKYPLGSVAAKPGIFFANTQEVDVIIKGKSAHVAFPENGIDSIKTMVSFLLEVEELIRKFLAQNKKIVCYFGKINSGNVRNAISDLTVLEGTVRALELEDFKLFVNELYLLQKKMEKQNKSSIDIILTNFYQSVSNDNDLVRTLENICKESGFDFFPSNAEMTGEDFGYFSHLYPSLLFWLGTKEKETIDLHSSYFLPSEKCIKIGISILKRLI